MRFFSDDKSNKISKNIVGLSDDYECESHGVLTILILNTSQSIDGPYSDSGENKWKKK